VCSDEELLAYYTSFLKTVSMKLNERTVQFFFHTHKEKPSFPLYCEAIKLFRHPESMVRAAIRTLTLNVFAVPGTLPATPPPSPAATLQVPPCCVVG
jgi:protein CLEC16A